MTTSPVKNLPLPAKLKEATVELAYQSRLSTSKLISTIVDEIAAGTVPIDPPPPSLTESEVKYRAPASYPVAMQRASAAGVTLSEVIRRELERRSTAA